MSVDMLQDKIRKCKNPSVIDFNIFPEQLPPQILAEGDFIRGYEIFANELLQGLNGIVPAVRFSLSAMAYYGSAGLDVLSRVLNRAKDFGYYIFLDIPGALSPQEAAVGARALFDEGRLCFDGVIMGGYIGSDCLRPYLSGLKESSKDIFVAVRTANKTAPELQDLLTGTRLVHMAATEIVNRMAEPYVSRSGFSRVGIMAAASSADSLRNLRAKYKNLFMILDGYDYPNSNAKNCGYSFDRLGHGAIACAGTSVTAAWQDAETEDADYVSCAVQAAERMKKNLTRYVTIL